MANLLYFTPAVLGNVPRPSLFPTPALNYVKSVPAHLEQWVKCLDGPPGSVVIWSPDEARSHPAMYDGFRRVIERSYAFAARFGTIEVWRKKPAGPPDAAKPN